jgi:glycosyltransferase involved in cell wall biosynthesis
MSRPIRLAIVATHPIQYYAPLYRELARRPELELTVMFADQPTPAEQGVGFGVPFAWDVDLTSGYEHIWLHNRATPPRQGRFRDYDTPEVAATIQRGQFDAVLVHGWNARTYWQTMRTCWRSRIPLYVRGDSQLRDDATPWKRVIKRIAYPSFMRRFAACLSVGVRSDEYFRYYGARRIVRSPHFVDNTGFAARAASARSDARAAWGISPDDFVVLFAGKLVPKKRPADVIVAAAQAASPRTVVLLAGDGELRSACERAAQAVPSSSGVRVVFTGFLNQTAMPRAYAAADVLVLPSASRETWGLVVNEAMACGRPAFVSDAAGCVPDLIVPGVTGDRFVPGDVTRLAALLRAAASNRAACARMGVAACGRVAGYSAGAAATGVIDALSEHAA